MVSLLRAGIAALALICAAPVSAGQLALVIANAADDGTVGAGAVIAAGDAMANAGVAVLSARDASSSRLRSLESQIRQMAPQADGLAVILAGRFVHRGDEVWFLPADIEDPGRADLGRDALALSDVLSIMARGPGPAVLGLGAIEDARPGDLGWFLRAGPGSLVPPDGVTLVRGTPNQLARFMRAALATPDVPMIAAVENIPGLALSGHRSRDRVFLADTGLFNGSRDDLPARLAEAEATGAAAVRSAEAAQETLARADAALWANAQAEDNQQAYRRYIEVFPEGRRIAAARAELNEIRNDPLRAERLAEQRLGLGAARRQEVQRDLTALGHDTRGIDGIFGSGTRAALRAWQVGAGFPATGFLDAGQVRALADAADDRRALARADAVRQSADSGRQDLTYWGQTGANGQPRDLRRYLDRYPNGRFSRQARAALGEERRQEREEERADTRDRAEREAWRRATFQNTAGGYRDYLQAFPRGFYADNARARLQGLEGPATAGPGRGAEDRLGLTPLSRRAIEQRLGALGFGPGSVDGTFDAATRRAIRAYQGDANLTATGYLDQASVARLLADSLRDLLR